MKIGESVLVQEGKGNDVYNVKKVIVGFGYKDKVKNKCFIFDDGKRISILQYGKTIKPFSEKENIKR